MTSFYTAELTAFLTLTETSLPVNDLAELRNDVNAKWIGVDAYLKTMASMNVSYLLAVNFVGVVMALLTCTFMYRIVYSFIVIDSA